VQAHPPSTDLTKPTAAGERGWAASPAKKFERLLRETGVPIGLLTNGVSFQLIYAPPKENSGTLTFNVASMTEISGRLILGAFHLLLNAWTLLSAPTPQRLPALLQTSRSYQASVSEKLAEQVLHALYELLRGFVAAEQQAKTQRLYDLAVRRPEDIYGGLVTVLLRLVFVLFAEDRALLPTKGLFVKHYSVRGLFERLRADAERHPDTMEHRYGAWAQLLALFRLIHGGCQHEEMQMPAREGHLFDFNRYPFLEGRSHRDDPIGALPLVSDGVIYGILEKLCVLEGERVSYRTLDVEEIGSVYQTIMGFGVEVVAGVAIALKGKRKKGAIPAAVVVDLESLLELKPADRIKHLAEQADTKLPADAEKQVKAAVTVDDLLAALGKRIDTKATPSAVAKGGLVLQPNDERRRSGSHYTPRSFTEPIVRKTLEPVLARLVGTDLATVPADKSPAPAQILDLKVADIAVGSAAFLVEACRQLGDALVKAWRLHGGRPPVPPDETEELLAMRLVAQRCLYGVDRNPMAVDLAKLSLWLATLAKDHPFTFLDHNLRCGDSLVGLTQKQIEAFTWEEKTAGKQRILGQDFLEKRIKAATAYRRDILEGGDYVLPSLKAAKLKLADEALDEVRFAGDLIIAAFCSADSEKARKETLDELKERYIAYHSAKVFDPLIKPSAAVKQLKSGSRPILPFHWEIEFPEVFTGHEGGFSAVIGNPPFLGGQRLSEAISATGLALLKTCYVGSQRMTDLVAFFFQRSFQLLRTGGALGLIATKTISQGDTRLGGLYAIRLKQGIIYSATRRVRWPGAAAVIVSVVHVSKSKSILAAPLLDGIEYEVISSYLYPNVGDAPPERLIANRSRAFVGGYPYGEGFLFDDHNPNSIPRSALDNLTTFESYHVHPYIVGDDLLNDPLQRPRRQVIDINDYTDTDAQFKIPNLYQLLLSKVYNERMALRDTPDSKKYKESWWKWARHSVSLNHARKQLSRQLTIAVPAKYYTFSFVPIEVVVGAPHVVIAADVFSIFTVLQSTIHSLWSSFVGSSIGDTLRYAPTDCFETFPFPFVDNNAQLLESAGKDYYEFRAVLMVKNNEGLTDTYNRFHDPEETSPEILKLRELHTAMDRAVLDAYGWTDISTECEFLLDYEDEEDDEATGKGRQRKKPWRYRWPDLVRDEVLARLLKLNAERAEQERLTGIAATTASPKPAKKSTAGARPGRKPKADPVIALPKARYLPTDLRLSENDPAIYAVGLIFALLSESGGTLPWPKLLDAFVLATQPTEMVKFAPPELEAATTEWAQHWDEKTKPGDLLPAIRTLASGNLSVDESLLGLEFSLQDGPKKLPPHVSYDAWLALRVAATLEPSAALIPAAQRDALTAQVAEFVA
jgi:hypothetical protein